MKISIRHYETFWENTRLPQPPGWAGLKNGELLQAAEDKGMEVLLTGDGTLHYEQNLTGRRLGNRGVIRHPTAHHHPALARDNHCYRQRDARFLSGSRLRHV